MFSTINTTFVDVLLSLEQFPLLIVDEGSSNNNNNNNNNNTAANSNGKKSVRFCTCPKKLFVVHHIQNYKLSLSQQEKRLVWYKPEELKSQTSMTTRGGGVVAKQLRQLRRRRRNQDIIRSINYKKQKICIVDMTRLTRSVSY